MRRTIVSVLVLGLLAGASVGPAGAKKRKPAPPVTFEASGSIAVADVVDAWVVNGPTSVTIREFTARCAVPLTQGFDAYVVELSDAISKVPADVTLTWTEPVAIANLRMIFTNEECMQTGRGSQEGTFPAGTKYVIVTASTSGVSMEFTLTAREIRRG